VIVNVAGVVPDGTFVTVTLLTVKVGNGKLLTIVPVAHARPRVPPAGLDRFSAKVSVGSQPGSPLTYTVTVWLVWPGAKVKVPLRAV